MYTPSLRCQTLILTSKFSTHHNFFIQILAMGWITRFWFPAGAGIFSSLPYSDWLWNSLNFLHNRTWRQNSQSIMFTTHLHLVLRLRICGAMPPPSICFHNRGLYFPFHTLNLNHVDFVSGATPVHSASLYWWSYHTSQVLYSCF